MCLTETGALVVLFLLYITFEYLMLSHVPLITELHPGVQATAMSFHLTGHSLDRALGVFPAPFIYQQFGFLYVTLLALAFNIFGLTALRKLQN